MKRSALFPMLALALVLLSASAVFAAPGDVVLSTSYPSVLSDKGKPVTFTLTVTNRTTEFQEVELQADGPADWNPTFKSFGLLVKRVMVEPSKSQQLDFSVKAPEAAKNGDYAFGIRAIGKDGKVASELKLNVTLSDKPTSTGLKLQTQFPELRGTANSTTTFRVTLTNDAEVDRSVSFAGTAPKDWEVTFKPAYETRQVTVMSVRGNATQDVDVDIRVPTKTEAGSYQVTVRATADKDRAELPLKVIVTGSNRVTLTTQDGTLSARASVGAETKKTIVIKNAGSAALQDITFSSYKPDGWDVTFTPEKIDALSLDQSLEVNVGIKPSSKALAGDYMVTLNVNGPQTSDSRDIRVTVETPTTWGFVAIAAIAVVFGGLAYVFSRFSRR